MAMGDFHARMVSRSNAGSKSAVGAAAYQARERIEARGMCTIMRGAMTSCTKRLYCPRARRTGCGTGRRCGRRPRRRPTPARGRITRRWRGRSTRRCLGGSRARSRSRWRGTSPPRPWSRGMAVDMAHPRCPRFRRRAQRACALPGGDREVTPDGFGGGESRKWARTALLRRVAGWSGRRRWKPALERTGALEHGTAPPANATGSAGGAAGDA